METSSTYASGMVSSTSRARPMWREMCSHCSRVAESATRAGASMSSVSAGAGWVPVSSENGTSTKSRTTVRPARTISTPQITRPSDVARGSAKLVMVSLSTSSVIRFLEHSFALKMRLPGGFALSQGQKKGGPFRPPRRNCVPHQDVAVARTPAALNEFHYLGEKKLSRCLCNAGKIYCGELSYLD